MVFSHIGINLQASHYRSKAVSFFEYSIFFNMFLLYLAKYHTSVGGGSEIAASYTHIGIVFLQLAGVLIFRTYSVSRSVISHHIPMKEPKEQEGMWRYDVPMEMQTTQYSNAKNVL